ncbi:MAG: helix-turn-helix domain-containing protein [Candidatus Helarchaeales archaeon]
MEQFLRIFGLNELEYRVFLELFNVRDRTARELSRICGISQAKIYNILDKLEIIGLITKSSSDGKTKRYSAINPSQIVKLRNEILDDLANKSDFLLDDLSRKYREIHSKGLCSAKPTREIITDKKLISLKIRKFLLNAKQEVIFNGIPLDIIDKFGDVLDILNERGIQVDIYLPKMDFMSKFFKNIKKYKPRFIAMPMQIVGVNEDVYFAGNIIIDRTYLLEYSYDNEGSAILYILAARNCINNCMAPILFPDFKEVEQEPRFLPKEESLMKILRERGPLSKKELSQVVGISGKKLNEILQRLQKEEKISIIHKKQGKGRPRFEIILT